MESKVKCIWIGKSGWNPELGSVSNGAQMELAQDKYDRFKELNLIKDVVTETKTSKKSS